jgi:hypothetical protein
MEELHEGVILVLFFLFLQMQGNRLIGAFQRAEMGIDTSPEALSV